MMLGKMCIKFIKQSGTDLMIHRRTEEKQGQGMLNTESLELMQTLKR